MTLTRRAAVTAGISYDVIGTDGPPLAFIHGSGGNRATWFPLVPLLGAHHRLALLDVRGFGRSSLEPGSVVEDLEAIRTAEGLARWSVLGHSLGGWHAVHYAEAHPEVLDTVVVASSIAGPQTAAVEAFFADFASRMASWTPGDAADSTESMSQPFCAAHPELAYLHHALRALNPGAEAMLAPRWVPAEVLGRVPMRYLTGSADPYAPPEVVRASAAAIPGAAFAELPAAGHVCFWEQPEAFATVVKDWLAETATP